jgi:hypothetical protein
VFGEEHTGLLLLPREADLDHTAPATARVIPRRLKNATFPVDWHSTHPDWCKADAKLILIPWNLADGAEILRVVWCYNHNVRIGVLPPQGNA